DLKHALASNPLHPAYRDSKVEGPRPNNTIRPPQFSMLDSHSGDWPAFPADVYAIGHGGPAPTGSGFAFDNESPRHSVYLDGFRLADRLVTNAEYLAFLEDGGYERPELWLSDGWAVRQAQGWT